MLILLPTTRQVSSTCKQRACLLETQLSALNIIILLETQLFRLKDNYLVWKTIILLGIWLSCNTSLFSRNTSREQKYLSSSCFDSSPRDGTGAQGSFRDDLVWLWGQIPVGTLLAWSYLIFSHLHLHRYPHLDIITLKFAGQIFVQGGTFIWQHVHEVV